ncbi:MAG: hypothetical protein U0V64_15395 [Cyclobacteriaceae bacterium]
MAVICGLNPHFDRKKPIFSIILMLRRPVLLILLLIGAAGARGQSANAPLNEDYYHTLDRYEIKSGRTASPLFTTVKPYRRSAIAAYLDTLHNRPGTFTSSGDQFNWDYLRNDSWEYTDAGTADSKRSWKGLYRKQSDFVHVDQPVFDIHVSPVAYFGGGKDSRNSSTLFINTRGVEIRGRLDNKIAFYTFLTDNQSILPQYVSDQMGTYPVVPHEGFWKRFKSNGVDFFQARAYIDVNLSKHLNMQFGHDRMFIGNGFRSLIYSDFSSPGEFVRFNVNVWKLNYHFSVNRLTADTRVLPNQRYPEKYVAFHHASVNIGKKLNLGFFESIVFSPADTLNNGTFELNYLNPVIFYRAIEQQNGSSDNAILGGDFKWIPFKKVSVYGQFVLDEFVLKNVKAGNGWWANKFAVQGGVKYIDALNVSNLDLQAEVNIVRPFTYSHQSLYTNYSNYLQPLAHPLGANFYELAGIVRYQPGRLNVVWKNTYAVIGRDATGNNFGGDINKSYVSRTKEYGNTLAQGVQNKIAYSDLTISYMVKHNIFIDARQTFRISKSADTFYQNNTTMTTVALRWNIAKRSYDF